MIIIIKPNFEFNFPMINQIKWTKARPHSSVGKCHRMIRGNNQDHQGRRKPYVHLLTCDEHHLRYIRSQISFTRKKRLEQNVAEKRLSINTKVI